MSKATGQFPQIPTHMIVPIAIIGLKLTNRDRPTNPILKAEGEYMCVNYHPTAIIISGLWFFLFGLGR